MTFDEFNARLKLLIENEDIQQAKALWDEEGKHVAAFSGKQQYMIGEKLMILAFKSGDLALSARINRRLSDMAPQLGEQYALTAELWGVNIAFAQKAYSRALYQANMLKRKLPPNAPYQKTLGSEVDHTLLRLYIAAGRYKRMEKLGRKMRRREMEPHSRMKLLMNLGAAYYSLGKYADAAALFELILSSATEHYYLGCAQLYLARMAQSESAIARYEKAAAHFRAMGHGQLLHMTQHEQLARLAAAQRENAVAAP